MLAMLPKRPKNIIEIFRDTSCGNGNLLAAAVDYQINKKGMSREQALKTVFGCDIDNNNRKECQDRLINGNESLRYIVNHNIITADALDSNHDGWKDVGFYWSKDDPTGSR
jgi:hypothetical protein